MKRYIETPAPTLRVRRWFTADELAWFVTRVLAWAGVGAASGFALVIIARNMGVPV